MANVAVTGGLMPHQKDEYDIWICKDCGWKYPNAKPSPKIRNNHKKHCPGKAGTEAHATGGSSDEVSDDHHQSPLRGNVAPQEIAVDGPVPQVETSRDFDLESLQGNHESEAAPAEAPIVNIGAAKEARAENEATAAAVMPGGLMPHQKDEYDIWICKVCGWKYPNARPSPKIRKNHKKHCPGKGGPVAPGGSSDEASDDEHHHASAAPAECPPSISREMNLDLEEAPSPETTDTTSTTDLSPYAGNGTEESSPPASEPARIENAIPQQPPVEIPPAVKPEKEDPAPKGSSDPVVKHKTPAASTAKISPAVPARKRITLQNNEKPPWRY